MFPPIAMPLALPLFIIKFACLEDISASFILNPFRPLSSISFPAELFNGFLNTLPAL